MSQSQYRTLRQRAAFDQCDPAGILFSGHYPLLAHRAIEEFVVHMGFSWGEWFQHPQYAIPLRHLEVNYLSPLRAGELYDWTVSLGDLGETSVPFKVEVRSVQDPSVVCAQIQSVHVFLDIKLKQKTAIPLEFRHKLEPFVSSSKL